MRKRVVALISGVMLLGTTLYVLASSPLSLTGELDLEGKVDHENNAIDLFWNEMPDRSQPYIYRVYQRKEGSEEFQTISTMDIDKGKKVRVLNVYPDSSSIPMITYTTHDGTVRKIKKSASLEMWMETPNGEHSKGYGMGLIDVDPVPLTEFNTNPERFLKNPDGSWKYDTVFFGSWDTNGGAGYRRRGRGPHQRVHSVGKRGSSWPRHHLPFVVGTSIVQPSSELR